MNLTTELPFTLEGVDGECKIVYTPFNQKFYQNGQEIKKTGSGFGGLKYKIRTIDGGDDILKVKAMFKQGRQIEFRGVTTDLEQHISVIDLLLSALPFVFITFLVVLLGSHFGVIDAALLGGCGALGMLTIGNMSRKEKDLKQRIIYSIIISVVTTALFAVLALIVGLILGSILGFTYALM